MCQTGTECFFDRDIIGIDVRGMIMEIIRSARKTLSLEVKPDGSVLVRAPYGYSDGEIEQFIKKHKRWLEDKQKKAAERSREAEKIQKLTFAQIQELADKALKVIPERVAFFAPKVGVTYGRVTIRNQKTRWGSCSSKGNLNFNCLLMLTPPEVIDSVVVHELCHRKEMNHSDRFYAEVLRVFPEYHKWSRWLKEHGPGIMHRMTGS